MDSNSRTYYLVTYKFWREALGSLGWIDHHPGICQMEPDYRLPDWLLVMRKHYKANAYIINDLGNLIPASKEPCPCKKCEETTKDG